MGCGASRGRREGAVRGRVGGRRHPRWRPLGHGSPARIAGARLVALLVGDPDVSINIAADHGGPHQEVDHDLDPDRHHGEPGGVGESL